MGKIWTIFCPQSTEKFFIHNASESAMLCFNVAFVPMNGMKSNPVRESIVILLFLQFDYILIEICVFSMNKGFVGFKLLLRKIESGQHMVRSNDPIYSKDIEVKYELYCHQTDIHGSQLQTWRDEGSHIHKRRNFHTVSYFQHPIDFDAESSVVASKQYYELTVAEEKFRPHGSLCFGCHIEIKQCKKKKKKKPIKKNEDLIKKIMKKEGSDK